MPSVTLSTGSLHYLEQGQGDPLILLHANPGDSRDFAAVIPALAQQFRVLALDWPGYGKSVFPPRPNEADCLLFYNVLVEFMATLKISRATLVGCSLGGNAAARLAIEQPEKVAGLVLIAPGGFTPHDLVSRNFCRLQSSTMALTPLMWASRYLKVRNPLTLAMLERAATEQSHPQRRAMNRAIWRSFALPEHDLRQRASAIQCPVLMFFGHHDVAIQAKKDGMVAQRSIPHAIKQVLPCGHMAHAELPDAFLDSALPFLVQCKSAVPA